MREEETSRSADAPGRNSVTSYTLGGSATGRVSEEGARRASQELWR
jgi:hypothetical protein